MTQQYPPPPPGPYGPPPQQWAPYPQAMQPPMVPGPMMPGPMMPPPQMPPPPPRKARVWPWVVGGIVLLLIVVSALGGKGTSTPPTAAAGTAVPTAARAAAPVPASTVAAPAQDYTPAAVPAGPRTSFGDGTWVVGEDIVPGTYKTPGAQHGVFEFCSVTTHSGDTTDSPIVDIAAANADEPIRIKVSGRVKSVEVHGCEDFVKVG